MSLEPNILALESKDLTGLFIFGALGDPNIYKLDKIRNKIGNKEVTKIINVQNKIINIILN